MTFGERLKGYRKQTSLSQEKLAELVGVSRQAITKWETDMGIPDIENIMSLSELFNVSLDELLAGKKEEKAQKEFLYESITEYDIDSQKDYDIKLGGVAKVIVSGYGGEKINVRLASNTIPTIQNDFKVKIDDIKKRIDVDLSRFNGMTESNAKKGLYIFVLIPQKYVNKVDFTVNSKYLELVNLECQDFELNGKVSEIIVDGIVGVVELNCSMDMQINCKSIKGSIEINQISATSRINVPANMPFRVVKKGIATSITYEKNGKITEGFSNKDADNIIEFNGIKSELVIYTNEEA